MRTDALEDRLIPKRILKKSAKSGKKWKINIVEYKAPLRGS